MVLGGALEDALRKRRQKQIDDARTEVDSRWRAWNERRLAALENGEPFDEPPPDITVSPNNGARS